MVCPQCSKGYDDSFKFCPNCGEQNPIAASPQQPPPQQPPPPVSLPQQQGGQPSAQSVSPEGSRQQVATPTSEIQVGGKCIARSDIVIDGKTAFFKGNYIDVESINPNPAKAGYKYEAYSKLLGKHVELSDQELEKDEESERSRNKAKGRAVMPLEAAKKRYMSLIGWAILWLFVGDLVIFFVFRISTQTLIVTPLYLVLLLYAIIWYGIRIEMRPWQIVLAVPLHLLLWVPGVLYMFHMTEAYEKTASLNAEPGRDVESTEASGVKPNSLTTSFPPIPPSETRAAEVKRKKGKYVIVALVILGVALAVVVTSIIIWSGDNKKNAYATKAKELIASRSELLGEERDATIAFEEGRKQVDTYTDPTLMRTGYSGLADKYIPIFQGYYDRTKSIKDELALMEPPSEFQQFHDLYLKSCDSFCKAFTSIMDSFRLLQNINESTGSQMNSISVTIDRYSNEGTDLTQQAQQAWPQ